MLSTPCIKGKGPLIILSFLVSTPCIFNFFGVICQAFKRLIIKLQQLFFSWTLNDKEKARQRSIRRVRCMQKVP